MSLTKNEFQCARCQGVFTKAWSDEESQAEAIQDPFGFQTPPENDPYNGETAMVCDDCFEQMKVWVVAHGGIENAMACTCRESDSCAAR